jgi:putative nucleotidyltransferase with HDIG domain
MKNVVALQIQAVELPEFASNFVQRIMLSLKMHDSETYDHCLRVAHETMALAKDLGLSDLEQSVCMYAGLLHDVGKVKVPSYIINKPGKLTPAEYDLMKRHAEFGAEMIAPLESLPFFKKVAEAILYHHERVDGQGYHGLSNEQIPYVSKLILAVDTVDAMTQDRPYRKGCTMERAMEELVQCSGTQFDPDVAGAYIERISQREKIAA